MHRSDKEMGRGAWERTKIEISRDKSDIKDKRDIREDADSCCPRHPLNLLKSLEVPYVSFISLFFLNTLMFPLH